MNQELSLYTPDIHFNLSLVYLQAQFIPGEKAAMRIYLGPVNMMNLLLQWYCLSLH